MDHKASIDKKPKEKSEKVVRLGLDTSKRYIEVHGVDEREQVVMQKRLVRENALAWFANLPPCLIGIEACASSHYWARELTKLGHRVKIIAAEFVKPYRKSGKNDSNDAAAACEAVSRPSMRFVSVKSEEQQAMLSVHRVRQGYVEERTATVNRLRGLLAEYGIWLSRSVDEVRRAAPLLLAEQKNLPVLFQAMVRDLLSHLRDLDERVTELDKKIKQAVKNDAAAKRVQEITGVGEITASAFTATISEPKHFKNGRQCSAFIGLTPRQRSTGGITRLGRITKRGDAYLRTLLIQGARSTLQTALRVSPAKVNHLQAWILALYSRVGYYKTLVSIANKHARMMWAMLAKGEKYDIDAWKRYVPVQG